MSGYGNVQYISGSVFLLLSLPLEWGRCGPAMSFKSARTVDFDFSQWFARIVFSCYFLYPFDAMLEDLILPSYVSSVISSILFQVFLRY